MAQDISDLTAAVAVNTDATNKAVAIVNQLAAGNVDPVALKAVVDGITANNTALNTVTAPYTVNPAPAV